MITRTHWIFRSFTEATTGFNNENWVNSDGHPGSDGLVVTERFRRKDFGHLDVQVRIDDPKAYAKPWTFTLGLTAAPDNEIMEYICSENNRYSRHPAGK